MPGSLADGDPEDAARDAFDALVMAAMAAIPEPYATGLQSVAVVVEDEPLPGQAPPGGSLFGLYQGVPRARPGADSAPIPSLITIFRRPHERSYPDPDDRARAVGGTLRHELAHHLGMDEGRLREIEAGQRNRRRGGNTGTGTTRA